MNAAETIQAPPAPVYGAIHENGVLVWDGSAWVPHGGPPLPLEHRDQWPDRLVMSSHHGWQPRRSVYVSTPTYSGVAHAEYMRSIIDLTMGVTPWGIELRMAWPRGDGIARCRNRELATFLNETECTHFACIDSDIGFQPKHFVDMLTSGLDFTAGAYPAKGYEWQQMMERVQRGEVTKPEQMETAGLRFVINYRDEHSIAGKFPTIDLPDGRRFVEVAEASTGFWLVRRSVIERMVAAYPEMAYWDDTPGNKGKRLHNLMAMGIDPFSPYELAKRNLEHAALRASAGEGVSGLVAAANALAVSREGLSTGASLGRYLSEDYAFCRLATSIGIKVYIYISAHLSHTGICVYSGAFGDTLKSSPPDETAAAPEAEQRAAE